MARNFARGAPPPPGSIEYVAVGDMFDPEIAARKYRAARSSAGFAPSLFTDLDASANYLTAIDGAVKQTRRRRGDSILSRQDERSWNDLLTRFRALETEVRGSPMSSANRKTFESLVGEARRLARDFESRGMDAVPPPYAGELLGLLRSAPSEMTASDMQAKLLAGSRCGDRLLASDVPWTSWRSGSTVPLEQAVADARAAADLYGRSRKPGTRYGQRSPVRDEFTRRLTKIWVEAARLYGVGTPPATTTSGSDPRRDAPGGGETSATSYLVGLLALAGVGYLGAGWLVRSRRQGSEDMGGAVVGVPDAYPQDIYE